MGGFYFEIFLRVIVFFYALWIGGLSTTIYNRIPNNIPIGPTHKPSCNNCGNEIKFKYFFPVLGYFFSGGKCIHCGMKISKIYLLLELSILSYILILSLNYITFDEKFISKSLYGSFLIVLMFIYKTHKQFKTQLLWMLVSFILAYRGYNYLLPNVIDLFISGVISYMIFLLLKNHFQVDVQFLRLCLILMISLNYTVDICFLIIIFIGHILNYYKVFEKVKICRKIDSKHIFFIPLITALILSFFD